MRTITKDLLPKDRQTRLHLIGHVRHRLARFLPVRRAREHHEAKLARRDPPERMVHMQTRDRPAREGFLADRRHRHKRHLLIGAELDRLDQRAIDRIRTHLAKEDLVRTDRCFRGMLRNALADRKRIDRAVYENVAHLMLFRVHPPENGGNTAISSWPSSGRSSRTILRSTAIE